MSEEREKERERDGGAWASGAAPVLFLPSGPREAKRRRRASRYSPGRAIDYLAAAVSVCTLGYQSRCLERLTPRSETMLELPHAMDDPKISVQDPRSGALVQSSRSHYQEPGCQGPPTPACCCDETRCEPIPKSGSCVLRQRRALHMSRMVVER